MQTDRLTVKLLHAIDMEKRAATRIKRASTLLDKWTRARRRIEKAIGAENVQRIIDRRFADREVRAMQKKTKAIAARLVNTFQGESK